ncbi:MAG: phosphatase PAP2 family protein [Bacteroidota bacterium]
MKLFYSAILLFVLSVPARLHAQKTDSLVKDLDSMTKAEAQPGVRPLIDVDKDEYTSQTNITPKTYFILLGTDMIQEVKAPFHASKKTWIKVGLFAALEGALFFADKPVQRFSANLMKNNPGFNIVSTQISHFGGAYEGYVLAGFAAYGLIFKSNKVKTTTLLATQAYITAGAMSYAVKYLTSRQRPNALIPGKPEPDNSVFKGPPVLRGTSFGSGFNSSFPSGHTTAAFSAATVFAYEYKDQILIPVIAYASAALVGLSRITENAHWLTDVAAGAALGYVTGKQVVNNYHRYARLKASGQQKKVSVLFNLDYANGVLMPGMVCKF